MRLTGDGDGFQAPANAEERKTTRQATRERTMSSNSKMTDSEIREGLRELAIKYNELRAKWIAQFGSDMGFNEWFSAKVRGN